MVNSRIHLAVISVSLLACAGLAAAQMPPGDPKLGTQVAMQGLNNSGQDGEVTLFGRNGGKVTLVVISLEGTPHRPVPASIHLSKSAFCDAIAPAATYRLKPVTNGKSSTLLDVPIMHLLNGHYSVVVSQSAASPAHYTACGALRL